MAFKTQVRATSLEEKPYSPKSHYAVTGLYFYDQHVADIVDNLKPLVRAELEMTHLNRFYLERNQFKMEIMGRSCARLDTGTQDSLIEASNFIETIEHRKGLKAACPEKINFYKEFIKVEQLEIQEQPLAKNGYEHFLISMLRDSVLR